MTETGQNFELHAGESKEVIISVYDDNGSPVDLSDYTVIWKVFKQTTKEVVLSKSLSSGITISGAYLNDIVIQLLPADTVNLTPAVYNHEGEIDSGPSNHATVAVGTVRVLFSV